MLSAGDPSSLAGPANLNKDIEDEIGKSISVPSAGQNEGFPPHLAGDPPYRGRPPLPDRAPDSPPVF